MRAFPARVTNDPTSPGLSSRSRENGLGRHVVLTPARQAFDDLIPAEANEPLNLRADYLNRKQTSRPRIDTTDRLADGWDSLGSPDVAHEQK
jgi:hypothetical protein